MTRRGWATGLFVLAAVLVVGAVAFSFLAYAKFTLPNDKRVWLVPLLVRDGVIDGAKWNEQITTFNRALRLDARGRLDDAEAQHNIDVIADWVAPRPPPRLAAGALWLGVLALGLMFFAALAALNGVHRWERRCLLLVITLLILSIPFIFLANLAVGFTEVKDHVRARILLQSEVVHADRWNALASDLGVDLPKWPASVPNSTDAFAGEVEWRRTEVLMSHLTKTDLTSQRWITWAFSCSVGALVLLSIVMVLRRVKRFATSAVGESEFSGAASRSPTLKM